MLRLARAGVDSGASYRGDATCDRLRRDCVTAAAALSLALLVLLLQVIERDGCCVRPGVVQRARRRQRPISTPCLIATSGKGCALHCLIH